MRSKLMMPGIITGLKPQKSNNVRLSIFIDGRYAFSMEKSLVPDLRVGQSLSTSDIDALKRLEENRSAYHRALRYLSLRLRSIDEMKRYLRAKEYKLPVIEYVIARLIKEKYLDDDAFARAWRNDRMRFKPRSAIVLRHELQQKGIDRDVILNVLADYDDRAAAWQLVNHRLKQWKSLDAMNLKNKIHGFLKQRGFDFDTISETYQRAKQQLNPM